MELIDAIMLSAFAGALPALVAALFWTIVHTLAVALVVAEPAQVSNFDRILAESGWCSRRRVGPSQLPASGYHLVMLRGGLVVARRDETAAARENTAISYTVYVFGAMAVSELQRRLGGNTLDVVARYIYAPMPWRVTSSAVRCAPPAISKPWQAEAVRALLREYELHGRVSALVCGAPGLGKSTVGMLLAKAIQTELRARPEVVMNLDLTMRGITPEDVFHTPTSSTPVVLMMDEFDTTVKFAEGAAERTGKGEGVSLAETPSALLAILDRFNITEHLIIIATSNLGMAEMEAGVYQRYTRKGRFDVHLVASM